MHGFYCLQVVVLTFIALWKMGKIQLLDNWGNTCSFRLFFSQEGKMPSCLRSRSAGWLFGNHSQPNGFFTNFYNVGTVPGMERHVPEEPNGASSLVFVR